MGGNLTLRASSNGVDQTPPPPTGALAVDWANRTQGSDVVWHHDFSNANEVNNFRWSNGYGNGNDPQALCTDASNPPLTNPVPVQRITTDSQMPNCMEIIHPNGDNNGTHWWRPMSAFQGGTTTGNGRGAGNADPAAAGRLPVRSFSPVDQGSETRNFGNNAVYGNRTYWGTGGTYDWNELWVSVMIKVDVARTSTSTNQAQDIGKLFWFTRTDSSLGDNEIVVESLRKAGSDPTKDYFSMYHAGSPSLEDVPSGTGSQPGTQFNTVGDGKCWFDNRSGQLANCWQWPLGQWVTVMWHLKPGTQTGGLGGTSNNDTLIEVRVCPDGQNKWTTIWNNPSSPMQFDIHYGWNAIMCSVYHNGGIMTQFFHRYAKMIFSMGPIPPPQVNLDGTTGSVFGLAAAALTHA